MTDSSMAAAWPVINRPRFRASLATAFLLVLAAQTGLIAQDQPASGQQYYQLQIYQLDGVENHQSALDFLKQQYLPALNRFGIKSVGVFVDGQDPPDTFDVFVLTPFASIDQFAALNEFLSHDESWQSGIDAWSTTPPAEPRFARIDTRLLKSFSGMPQMEVPQYSKDRIPERVFELRIYESHTPGHARRKIRMFDDGEIQLMKDVGMGPVFFAETMAGPDMPCLVYMLSAESADLHKTHWQTFLNDPRWPAMRDKPEFKDTVSKIRNWNLRAADFSGM
jgi:hypothetical protein